MSLAALNRAAESNPIPFQQNVSRPSLTLLEEITRLALLLIQIVAGCAGLITGAYMIAGTLSAWHALTCLGLLTICVKAREKLKWMIDFSNPTEVDLARHQMLGQPFSKTIENCSIDAIMQYGLMELRMARIACCTELQGAIEHLPVSVLENKDKLLQYGIINQPMYNALVTENINFFKNGSFLEFYRQ